MSFCERNSTIKEGDTVIIYVSFNKIYPIKVTRGLSHSTKYGTFKHVELIGKKYGTKFECKQGSVYLLAGSPELWTLCLPHRTQIIYTPNISLITFQLELKPGSIVVESGYWLSFSFYWLRLKIIINCSFQLKALEGIGNEGFVKKNNI